MPVLLFSHLPTLGQEDMKKLNFILGGKEIKLEKGNQISLKPHSSSAQLALNSGIWSF